MSTNLLGIHPGLSQLQSWWLLHGDSSGGIARARGDEVPRRLQILFSTGKFHWQLTCVQDFTINIPETVWPPVSLGLF